MTHFVEGVRVWKGNEKVNGTRDRYMCASYKSLIPLHIGVSLISSN